MLRKNTLVGKNKKFNFIICLTKFQKKFKIVWKSSKIWDNDLNFHDNHFSSNVVFPMYRQRLIA